MTGFRVFASVLGGLVLAASLLGCKPDAKSQGNGKGNGSGADEDLTVKCGELKTPKAREVAIDLKETHDGSGKYEIVTTCSMVTDIVKQVAGEHATVTGLLGEGVDPHTYKPTRDTTKRTQEADVVFYSGLYLEALMEEGLENLAEDGKPVFAVTEVLDRANLRKPPEFDGHYDPHLWMDVSAWSLCAGFVADVLAKYDAAHADSYQANAKSYQEKLTKLDAYMKKVIGTVPEEQRVLITAHDAFGYFSCAYQLPVKSVQGISTETEASVADINRLVDLIVKRKVKAVFFENSVNSKNMQALLEGAESRDHKVVIGGELFSDAMGPSGTYEGTFIGMMDHNATVITRALGGEAPEKGMDGKLTLE